MWRLLQSGTGLVCLVLLLIAGAQQATARDLAEHPARSPGYWGQAWRSQPVAERVAAAPPEVLEYLFLDVGDAATPQSQRPRPVQDSGLRSTAGQVLEDIAASLPQHLAELLRKRLMGVFLAENIGSSGYTEVLNAPDGKRAFVVLDAAYLQGRRANAWASLRESSFFRPAAGVTVSMTIADRDADTEQAGMRYILLHELGHCVGAILGVHPDWNEAPPTDAAAQYPFVGLSWKVAAGKYALKQGSAFPWRGRLRIYSFEDAPLSASTALKVYAGLQQTNLPTLYAAVSPFEDFAESFAVWLHAVREKRPWLVRLSKDGGQLVFASCLKTGACPDKAAFMQQVFSKQ